jgi:hypothetical protein
MPRLKIVVSPVRVRVSPSPKRPGKRALRFSSESLNKSSFGARKCPNRDSRAQKGVFWPQFRTEPVPGGPLSSTEVAGARAPPWVFT